MTDTAEPPAGWSRRLDPPAWAALGAGPGAVGADDPALGPLARLLAGHAEGRRRARAATAGLLGADPDRPYLVGVTGGVAAGKSTLAAGLARLLEAAGLGEVAVVATDGFLFPNEELARRQALSRKGFPDTYDQRRLVAFLADVHAGRPAIAPVYSHLRYDVVAGAGQPVDRPGVLVLEGVNVLQAAGADPAAGPLPSDFLDVSVYLDAPEPVLAGWYEARLADLRRAAVDEPDASFRAFADLDDESFTAMARAVWREVNLVNLERHILPTRARANVVLEQDETHAVTGITVARL